MPKVEAPVGLLRKRQDLLTQLADVDRSISSFCDQLGINPKRLMNGDVKERGHRPQFQMTAEEQVKAILKERNGEANTRQIKSAWAKTGRRTSVYVVLSRMVADKALKSKRTNRMSVYTLV